ncbi:TonB-dependent receptor plug domain-containing protein [Epilithonimonas zeae]|uniref:TonB-dependent Receptor Plug Domain n=1 Tax=Epilithonimonas zeae TaxID=1416779 RepID=A0A1N6GUN7_9FLAO|nr:TonB-dependent receptor [Epilithonimonas zeae]SIO11284.1 TonB-dependent Receptor Plug Domain [Epilithonimonas zeae]
MFKYFYFFFFSFAFISIKAQSDKLPITIQVFDDLQKPLSDAVIKDQGKEIPTNSDGNATILLSKGKHILLISHERFDEKEFHLHVENQQTYIVSLKKEVKIEEVVITAKEGKGLTSKSVIDRQAMQHLQPSSFADLMELLPGGLARDPNLSTANRVLLRENTGGPSSYTTTSLGVQFMIDDNVWNTNANLQTSIDESQMGEAAKYRNTTGIGTDTRTISTNDIEKVEVIRGIPSAAYGDLTSGLIKIERKIGYSPLEARFKADGFSKQYYVGKGLVLNKNWNLNVNMDLLDSRQNPTDEFQNYQRITASIRSRLKTKLWQKDLEWRSNIDFSNNLDKIKYDPDTGYALTDSYKNSNQRISFTNNFTYNLDSKSFFNKIVVNTAIRQGIEKIEQVKLVQLSGPRALSLATTAGENVGIYPNTRYIAESSTDGKPLDLSLFLQTTGSRKVGKFNNQYEAGFDWKYSKNNGDGQQWDLETPPSATIGARPRAFKDIPAWKNLAVFAGNQMSYNLNQHKFSLYTGLRVSKLLGIDHSYAISKKTFAEPRVNFQYNLPIVMVGNYPLKTDVTLGYGILYKQPTLLMLYPNQRFTDYAQLNYYHDDENYRYVNFMTFVQNLENKNLTAAKNIKKEIRLDLSYRNHEFFITYFNENLKNGFRSTLQTQIISYKKYDSNYIDLSQWGENGPDLTNVPYETVREFGNYSITENGSATLKDGVEFGYTSPRIKGINTKFTLTGAWFRTQYRNTVPVLERPSISLAGSNYQYYGIYKNDLGYVNENLNYNLMLDTFIPSLGLIVSASIQGSLYNYQKYDQRIPQPISYVDLDGVTHTFTDADRTDTYRRWLVRSVTSDDRPRRETYVIRANFKVTKIIYKNLKTSMFVNRLFSYEHPYYFLGNKIERQAGNNPYFGMELNYNF